jgi:hypothetical protein
MTSTPLHPETCTCRAHPWPASMRVRDARDAYLAENGFTVLAYEQPTTEGSFLGLKIAVPNPPAHRRAIRLHDLLHVATGFGTDHAGEGEISAWQARRGLRGTGAYVTAIVMANALLGLVFAPRRTIAASRSAPSGRSIFTAALEYEQLLDLSVGELRDMLAIPPDGLTRRRRGLHALAPRES